MLRNGPSDARVGSGMRQNGGPIRVSQILQIIATYKVCTPAPVDWDGVVRLLRFPLRHLIEL